MKQALIFGPRDLRVVDVPTPEPGPGQVLVRVVASSPYGTDMKFYDGTLAPLPYPLGFGGDFAGTIAAVGEGVLGLAVGHRVSCAGTRHCGRCRMCRSGRTNLCLDTTNPAAAFARGFAEYAVLDANRVVRLPDNVGWEQAAMTAAISMALLTFERLGAGTGDVVVQLGGGPMGWGSILIGKRRGCRMLVSEPVALRRELSARFGADVVWDPTADDVAAGVARACPDGGPPYVIESAGTAATHRLALELAGVGARVAMVAANDHCLPAKLTLFKELTILGIRGVRHQAEAVALIARGEADLTPSITHRARLDDLPAVFRILDGNLDGVGRVLIDHCPSGAA